MVLDAWAVLSWLKNQEPGAEKVRVLLDAAGRRDVKLSMNVVNLGEIFCCCAKFKGVEYAERILENFRPRLSTVSATDDLVMLAARVKARHAISYADAFAVATALTMDAPLVTGDPELLALSNTEKTLKLEWVAG